MVGNPPGEMNPGSIDINGITFDLTWNEPDELPLYDGPAARRGPVLALARVPLRQYKGAGLYDGLPANVGGEAYTFWKYELNFARRYKHHETTVTIKAKLYRVIAP